MELTNECRETAYTYTLSYVRSLPPSSPSAQSAAVDAIAMALRLPTIFDFDPLFKLDAVVAAKDNELFSLLQVFLNHGVAEFRHWEEGHPAAFQTHSTSSSHHFTIASYLCIIRFGESRAGAKDPFIDARVPWISKRRS